MKMSIGLIALIFAPLLLVMPVKADDNDLLQTINEARLEGQLWTAFALNRHLSAFDLSVDVDGATATLEGKVEESVQKDLAEEIALGTNGIDRVRNRIEVTGKDAAGSARKADGRGFGDRVSDATTTATVKSKLLWNRNTQGLSINVSTSEGKVTLEGEANNEASKELAERLAANTDGVGSVNNRIRVTGDAAADQSRDFGDAVSDTWITTKVRSTLLFSTDVPGTRISVETRDGVVSLSGEVSNDREKQRAISLAADIQGVERVVADQLKVVHS